MYQATIVSVGLLREEYFRNAEQEYQKRLSPFLRLRQKELKEESFRTMHDRERVLKVEGERISKAIPKDAIMFVLEKEGRVFASEAFAECIRERGERGTHLCFVIGGPLGLSPDLSTQADIRLSLSSLTFTHGLARIVLLEQLYRAMTILHGKQYHY